MKKHSFYLEPYNGSNSRHECPKCHDPNSFTYYLDSATHQIIDPSAGRCNHESSCGYHYTPKDFYAENPDYRPEAGFIYNQIENKPMQEPSYIPTPYLLGSFGEKSDFEWFLETIIDTVELGLPTVERLIAMYRVGCTKDGETIFWQIDTDNGVRTGKVIKYDLLTGKRMKNVFPPVDWMHSRLIKSGNIPEDFHLVQCLFGEHLLPYNDSTVALVESEKTAIIGSGLFPKYLWLATGGKSQLSAEKLKVLKGRTVIMFPDIDGYELWRAKARDLELMGCNVIVSDLLEKVATAEDRENKIDIADLLIREAKAKPAKESES